MKTSLLNFATSLLAVAFIFPVSAQADDSKLLTLVNDLQKQMMQMQMMLERQDQKIRALEKREPQIQVTPSSQSGEEISLMSEKEFDERLNKATGGAQEWLKDLSLKGDLRLRYEAFDFHSGSPSGSADRNRFRYRLRFGLEKKFSEDVKIGFGLNSAETAGTGVDSGLQVDPTSANTSFDNLFNFKDIFIEKVYAQYSPSWAKRGPIEKTTVAAGKLDNPFEKGSSDMVWDRDVKPEGIYEKFDLKFLDSGSLDLTGFATFGQFILDEDIATGEADAELFAQQIGLNAAVSTPYFDKPAELLSAFSFYNYSDYAINGNFLIGTTSLARGNTNVDGPATVLDSEDFEVLEYYNEIALYPRGIPIRPFFDLAHNIASQYVGDEELAWTLGAKIGGIKKRGDWELSCAYRRIEPESLVGAFSDSDFGLGHAGKRGSILKLGYALTDNITVNSGASLVNNLTVDTAGVRDEEQRRFQLDMNWKF